MEKRNKLIHRIIVVYLALVCIFMNNVEDAFVQGAFLVATVYNLVHVFFLRKKTGETVLGAITGIALIWACVINVVAVSYMLYIFFAGYTYYGFLDFGPGTTYYGIDAWLNNLLVLIIAPVTIINFIYIGIYVAVKKKKKDKLN